MTRQEIIERDKQAIKLYEKKMETASIEDRIFCYQPKIEILKNDIKLLSKEQA